MFMNKYTPVIADLGLTQTHATATRNNFSGGTPLFLGYQICERGASFTIGPHIDLYALGVIFYLIITQDNPTWYISYNGYTDYNGRTRKTNDLLKAFDSILLRLLNETRPTSRGTIDTLL